MAITNITPKSNPYGVKRYICDSKDDINKICVDHAMPGSMAICMINGNAYMFMLNHKKQWELCEDSSPATAFDLNDIAQLVGGDA